MNPLQERCERESCRYFHPPPHLQARVKANQLNASSLMAAAAQSQALALVRQTLPTYYRWLLIISRILILVIPKLSYQSGRILLKNVSICVA